MRRAENVAFGTLSVGNLLCRLLAQRCTITKVWFHIQLKKCAIINGEELANYKSGSWVSSLLSILLSIEKYSKE